MSHSRTSNSTSYPESELDYQAPIVVPYRLRRENQQNNFFKSPVLKISALAVGASVATYFFMYMAASLSCLGAFNPEVGKRCIEAELTKNSKVIFMASLVMGLFVGIVSAINTYKKNDLDGERKNIHSP